MASSVLKIAFAKNPLFKNMGTAIAIASTTAKSPLILFLFFREIFFTANYSSNFFIRPFNVSNLPVYSNEPDPS